MWGGGGIRNPSIISAYQALLRVNFGFSVLPPLPKFSSSPPSGHVDVNNVGKVANLKQEDILVCQADFMNALNEVWIWGGLFWLIFYQTFSIYGMRCYRSDWPGLFFFCCYQPLCVVSQLS